LGAEIPQFSKPLLAACIGLAIVALLWLRTRHQAKSLRRALAKQEQQLRTLNDQLHHAHRMEAVGILAGSIINNLNNLLSVITGHVRMAIHDLPPDANAQLELRHVVSTTDVAREMLKEISDFYRQANQASKPTALLPVVRDTVKLLRDILPSSMSVTADLQPVGPVLASPTGVQQILMNLCSNSVNAIAGRQGLVEINLAETTINEPVAAIPNELKPGSYVCLSVKDNGRGMNAETLDRIFDSYFSDDQSNKKMGIGLSTVHRILEDHEGVTIVNSQLGRGTSFDIYFPLIAWSLPSSESDTTQTLDCGASPIEAETASDAGVPQVGRCLTVLLVDDEEVVAKVLAHGLKRLGYRVIVHTDCRTAFADFSATPELFDIVVTDQIMPHMSGVKLTRKIHEIRPRIPVILLTGFRDSFNEIQAREAGIEDFILKPFSHRDLANLIDRLVLRENSGRA